MGLLSKVSLKFSSKINKFQQSTSNIGYELQELFYINGLP